MKRSILLAALAASLSHPLPATAGTVGEAVAEAVRAAEPGELIPVIIRHAATDRPSPRGPADGLARAALVTDLKARAERDLAPLEAFLTQSGGEEVRRLWMIGAVAARIPPALVAVLAERSDVDSISLDGTVSEPVSSYEYTAPAEWNLAAVKAPDLWGQGITGNGIVVSLMDTGVDAAHADLAGRWRGGGNSWFDPHGRHAQPYDHSGHGTQVAGLMVGGDAGGSAIGMAPGARWIAAKIFDDDGTAQFSDIHLAFQWQLDPDGDPETDDAPHVVNNSWGLLGSEGQCVTEFRDDVRVLTAAGIMVTFSAGNAGPYPETSTSPANYPESVSVGAVDETGAVADFSSRGGGACDGGIYPRVAAPGVVVLTADRTFGVEPNSYALVTGTSFAAAHVAGGGALLREAHADSPPDRIAAALERSAADNGVPGPDNEGGHGTIDVLAAHLLLEGDDVDGDGWTMAGGDCDDAREAVHPGAAEVKRDGVDQDCNGYDLTIVATASYDARRDTLKVQAESLLGAAADLRVEGYGPMSWNRKKGLWELTVRKAGGQPVEVVIIGVEGTERVPLAS